MKTFHSIAIGIAACSALYTSDVMADTIEQFKCNDESGFAVQVDWSAGIVTIDGGATVFGNEIKKKVFDGKGNTGFLHNWESGTKPVNGSIQLIGFRPDFAVGPTVYTLQYYVGADRPINCEASIKTIQAK